MKKRLLQMFAVTAMTITSLTTSAATFTTADGFSVTANGTAATISGYTGDNKDVIIPAQVTDADGNTYNVTQIAASSFKSNANITSVDMSRAPLTAIGANSFQSCTNLKSAVIAMSGSSKTIGNYAFNNCSSLESVTFSGSAITNTGTSTFQGCTKLTSIEIPAGVTTIGVNCFSGCTSLASVSFPSSLKDIYSGAFQDCSALTEVDLLSTTGVAMSRGTAFAGASSLKTVKLPVNMYNNIGSGSFKGTAITRVICSDTPIENGINIPSSVTTIQGNAFSNCPELLSVDLTDLNLTTFNIICTNCPKLESFKFPAHLDLSVVGSSPFNGDNALTEITLPESDEYVIPNGLFNGASGLTTIIMKEGSVVTSIGNFAFQNCANYDPSRFITEDLTSVGNSAFLGSGITVVNFPNSLTSLGTSVFSNCSKLTSVGFNEDCPLTGIPNQTFQNCTSLETIALPGSISSIGNGWISGCSSLASVDLSKTKLTGLFVTNTTTSTSIFSGTSNSLVSVKLPGELTEIPTGAFQNFRKLEDVEIPETVTAIGNRAFMGCYILSGIELPSNLVTIGTSAFQGVPLKGELIIPATVREIGSSAFNSNNLTDIVIYAPEDEAEVMLLSDETPTITIGDNAFNTNETTLKTVYCYYKTPPTINANVFTNTQYQRAELRVYTPELYKEATGWMNFGESKISTGIDAVDSTESEVFEVYNLQGMFVTRTSDRNLSELPKGIYIVNGKKIAK